MTRFRRTYRDVDGQRVDGSWRHIFVRNADNYYLTDLVIYADGVIDTGTGGLTDVNGLAELLRCGKVATTLNDGAWASAHHLAGWRFAEAACAINAEMLLGEVADEIDRLNDRPDSTDRCLQAVHTYLTEPTENNRARVRQQYLSIPEHLRIYALGDMDNRDWPLKVLATAVGQPIDGDCETDVVTPELHADAIEYFRGRDLARSRAAARIPADGPAEPENPTLTLYQGRQERPGTEVLQNGYPAAITIDGSTYPTAAHAYWALSTHDRGWHDRIAAAPHVHDAVELAEQAPRRPGWPAARIAIMTRLLRAKFAQHPSMARTLLATGDARIVYTATDSAYSTASGQRGSNWTGRLLEVIRSEIAAVAAGVPLPGVLPASIEDLPETLDVATKTEIAHRGEHGGAC